MVKNQFEKNIEKYKKDTIAFARKKPAHFAAAVLAGIIILIWILSSLELIPEFPRFRMPRGMVVEKGDSMTWIGMRVIEISRSVRKEFKIPGKIKGMFVLDEGKDVAAQYGIKTGDVIMSVSRKPVRTAREFVKVANGVQYYGGILLDIYRDKETFYVTIPFQYDYGPVAGPNKGGWQLGAPLLGKAFKYGPVFNLKNNNNNNQNQ